MANPMVKLDGVRKIYRTSDVETHALNHVSLEIGMGEFVSIMGPSGCGKSTLLGILGLLDTPTEGDYWFGGTNVARFSESELTNLRRDSIGFIFQSFNLIDDLSVSDNVDVGVLYRKVPSAERQRRVAEALERVKIQHRAKHLPQQLSGGQQQRVAIARALVSNPKIILADEPTGNLDTVNGDGVMSLLKEVADAGTTVIMVTHSPSHAKYANRTINLLDGQIVDEAQQAV